MRTRLAGALIGVAVARGAGLAAPRGRRPRPLRPEGGQVRRARRHPRPRRAPLAQSIDEFAAGCPVRNGRRSSGRTARPFPDAKTDKNWPFVAAGGTRPAIDHAVIAIRGGRPAAAQRRRSIGTATLRAHDAALEDAGPRSTSATACCATGADDEQPGDARPRSGG